MAATSTFGFRANLRHPLGDGPRRLTAENIADLTTASEKLASGWYPVGASRIWHNGIHLTADANTKVNAMLGGRIVAVRVPRAEDKAKFPWGSPGFVLTAHELTLLPDPKEKDPAKWPATPSTVFVLYMSLSLPDGSAAWLKSIHDYEAFTKSKNPGAQEIRVVAGDEKQSANSKTKGLFAYLPLPPPKPPKKPTPAPGGAPPSPPPPQPGTHRAGFVKNGTLVELTGVTFEDDWVEVNAPTLKLKGVWVRSPGSHDLPHPPPVLMADADRQSAIRALSSGKAFALNLPVAAGETIGRVGQIVSDAELETTPLNDRQGVHLEVFSASNVIADKDLAAWPLVEDTTDGDVICEFESVVKSVKDPKVAAALEEMAWDTSQRRGVADVHKVLQGLDDETRDKLRHLVTRNTPYWSIDWQKMAAKNQKWMDEFTFSADDQEIANRYTWWADAGVNNLLPPDLPQLLLYYYQPLTFASYVQAHRIPPPVFFIAKDGKEPVVWRPADIDCASKKLDGHNGDYVFVYEDEIVEKWTLGFGNHHAQGKGLYRGGSPKLHHILGLGNPPAGAPTVDVPGLTEADRHIWASLWGVEGGLDAVNQYDHGVISVGAIQKTAAGGELPGAMWVVKAGYNVEGDPPEAQERKQQGAAAFAKHFSNFGLDVEVPDPEKHPPPRGHVTGKFVFAAPLKAGDLEQLRDFFWAYRFVKAIGDPAFNGPYFLECIERLRVIRALSHSFAGTKVTVAQVYKSELAIALILDTHINYPALAIKIWWEAAAEVLALGTTKPISLDAIHYAEEASMIGKLMVHRHDGNLGGGGPAAGDGRSLDVLLCTQKVKTDEAARKEIGLGVEPKLASLTSKLIAAHAPSFPPFVRIDSPERPRPAPAPAAATK